MEVVAQAMMSLDSDVAEPDNCIGRTLFDVTDGWNGRHTLDVPADWVASHPDAPFFCRQGDRVTHLVFPVTR